MEPRAKSFNKSTLLFEIVMKHSAGKALYQSVALGKLQSLCLHHFVTKGATRSNQSHSIVPAALFLEEQLPLPRGAGGNPGEK